MNLQLRGEFFNAFNAKVASENPGHDAGHGEAAHDDSHGDAHADEQHGKPDRRTLTIVLMDEERNDVLRWEVENAWINKIDGPSFKASGNEIAIGRIQNKLAGDGITLVTDRQSPIHVSGHPGRPELEALYQINGGRLTAAVVVEARVTVVDDDVVPQVAMTPFDVPHT